MNITIVTIVISFYFYSVDLSSKSNLYTNFRDLWRIWNRNKAL